MSTDQVAVTIVFKEGMTRNARYEHLEVLMIPEERDRLCQDFARSDAHAGVYAVTLNQRAAKLALRFADVLFIG